MRAAGFGPGKEADTESAEGKAARDPVCAIRLRLQTH